MKKFYIFIIASMLLGACSEDTPAIVGFEANIESIEAEAYGGCYDITIRSEQEWVARTDVPWIMVSPANGRGEVKCTIRIDSTLQNDVRNANLYITPDNAEAKAISISQKGFSRSIDPEKSVIDIAASAIRDDRWVEFDVKSNVQFDIENNDGWITVKRDTLILDRGARPRTTRVHLDWKMNSDPKQRETKLILKSKDDGTEATITIRQAAAPLIEDNRQGDSLAIITIFNKMECWGDNSISSSESMRYWDCVRLWESTDRNLPEAEAVGRVRDLDLSYFNTEDGVPVEIKHLKYLETLSLYGNVNTMLKSIDLCAEVATLAYLKDLRIAAMGLVSLPDNFTDLGDTLESLDLNSNNFNEIPDVINKENFPNLKSLNLSSNRRSSVTDLRKRASANEKGIGMYVDMQKSDVIKNLFLWEELEELGLSFNYIEGELPDFEDVDAYCEEDMINRGDTLRWAVENKLPRILPNMKALRINLNFMTGELPRWLLYHPRLMEWGAEVLIYPQQEKSTNSNGKPVGFDNVPSNTEYYFEAYPLYRGKYEYNEETEE
ncbi:MAG: hypothetical protein IKJ08_04995 [Alistipes sp.]|nr:hypothetical protein [Alistipes sp.]